LAGDNGKAEVKEVGAQPNANVGAFRRIRQPLFEKDLMTAGITVLDALPTAVFADEQAANAACRILGWLSQHLGEDSPEFMQVLWRINSTMAIGARARKDAVQAHGLLYYPDDVSKEDKKWLATMQQRRNQKDNDDNNSGGGSSTGLP